ncbi:porin [Noviherbaspirillum galbum]|uniref:Porin n=1 Tax=Noviherbaspirillum galbum TaxID=2709383 RepID=A0A6B3SSF8_9BURK|nr:porin [Noviherbaspirillum galbum]NEX63890.1 porin [Noviherbaspirillum galbum]
MKKSLLAGACALMGCHAAQAVEMQAGEWNVSVGGIVNAYYTAVGCSGADVAGIALAGKALGCGGEDHRTTIGNGLLPNALIVGAKSKQGGYDVGGTIGIMAHTATDSAIAANNGVDVRQAFITVGNGELGTFKLGRDYGIFGSNAILSDMTLLGAGAPVQATQRGRVTLGHIGAGYTYLGTYGQIAYSAPKAGGLGFDVALVSPVGNGGIFNAKSMPQLQGQVSVGGQGFKAWAGAKTQKFYSTTAAPDFNMNAFEIGASWTAGDLALLGNAQTGKGLGILSDGDQGDIRSNNVFLQATYKTSDKLKLGIGYGMSRNQDDTAGLRSNRNLTIGSYYALTKSVTLVGEVGQTRSRDVAGRDARLNGISLGGILFF